MKVSTTEVVREMSRRGAARGTDGGWSRRGQPAPTATTAALLLDLLSEDERYRRVWRARMERTPTSQVQQSAVARVLAQHLWESGDADEGDEALPRRLKDTVARALSGRNLSPRTLRMFVDAFDMSAGHRLLLWECLDREVGADPTRAETQAHRSPTPVPGGADRTWESTCLHERHTVGADGTVQHRVLQVVRAVRPLRTVSVPVPPGDPTVVARHGATVVPVRRTGAADLLLVQPLAGGETAVLEYDVLPGGGVSRTEVRTRLQDMAAGGTALVQVRFHPARLPRQLWWCRSDGRSQGSQAGEPPVPVTLDPDRSAHRVLTGGRGGTVGFRWAW